MNTVTLVADASFCPDTKAAGYGVWIAGHKGKKAFSGGLRGASDNNVAEAMAICNGLWHGLKDGLIENNNIILIQSDSSTAIEVLSGSNKANSENLKNVYSYLVRLAKRFNLTLRFKHVPGHTSGKDNRTKSQNKCDESAKNAMRKLRAEINNYRNHNGSNYLRQRARRNNG